MTPQHEWISVFEASRRLNCSVSTIRRMIEAGELVGEREAIGGSRERYRVRMPQDASGEASDVPPTPSTSEASEAAHDASGAVQGLLGELREMRQQQASERAADASRIAALEREAGELSGAVDAYRREVEWLKAELERARRSWWRLWG